jgi:hypothetical protein
MSALPQTPPVTPPLPAQPTEIDAFKAAMTAASSALAGSPDAMAQGLLSGIDNFNARETQFRTVVAQAEAGGAPQGATADASGAPPAGTDDTAPRRMTAAQAMQEGDALQQRSMALMMQTYSFALEATLVSNAATTFTSSVNTLIKTQ